MAADKGLLEHVSADVSLSKTTEQNLNAILDAQFKNSKIDEFHAGHVENVIRSEMDPSGQKIPLRSSYDVKSEHSFDNKVSTKWVPINLIKDGYRYYKK